MAEVTRAEWAGICRTTTAVINTNVVRKKIYVQDNKLIDTEHSLNKIFLKLRKQKDAKENTQRVTEKKIKKLKKDNGIPEESSTKKPVKFTPVKRSKEEKLIDSLSMRKLIADTEKAEKDSELKQLQLEKMMGKLIPVDLVHGILKINIQNIFISFENELVNLASIYCDIMASGDRSKLSEIIELMRSNLHRIIKDTKNNAAKEIKGVINEFSETRSRGERT